VTVTLQKHLADLEAAWVVVHQQNYRHTGTAAIS
jgi:hypothetical protein